MRFAFAMLVIFVLFTAFKSHTASQYKAYGSTYYYRDTLKSGEAIFKQHCSTCHKDSMGLPAPGYSILTTMTPQAVLTSLNSGKMRLQATNLTETERKTVSEWVTSKKITNDTFAAAAFTRFSVPKSFNAKTDHSGWGGNLAGTGFRTREQAGITPENVSSLQVKWAFAFPGATVIRSKPAVVGDWLIVGSQMGDVYALNRQTGKIGWQFAAGSMIRGAIFVTREGNTATAYFADYAANVYAINAYSGQLIWKQRAGIDAYSSVTGSVVVYKGKVFTPISTVEVSTAFNANYPCCSATGGLVALDAKTGTILWKHRVVPPAKKSGTKRNSQPRYGPSGAPVWSSPTIDTKRNRVYIGTGENYSYPTTNSSDAIQALDIETGKLVWNFQATADDAYNLACPVFVNCPEKPGPDLDFGMAPLLVKRKDGKEVLLAGQKSGVVHCLTPEGKLLWQTRIGKGGMLGGIHWGMASDGQTVYAANADNFNGLDLRDTSLKPSPGLYALDIQTGKVLWSVPTPGCEEKKNCTQGNSAAPLAIPGIVFAGDIAGHIRAYDAGNGKILWNYNTLKDFETTNGIKGKGGAIDGPSPVVCDGMLFVNSGYGMFGALPGNVLLAFEVQKSK